MQEREKKVYAVYSFVDLGTRLSAIRFWIPHWNRQHDTTVLEDNWEESCNATIKLLEAWGITDLVLEYDPNYFQPLRKEGSWGEKAFKELLTIITKIKEWALSKKIRGYAILPYEVKNERIKGNYCWRKYWNPTLKNQTIYFCEAHQKECGLEKAEANPKISEYEKEVRHRDEVDCLIIQKVFQTKIEPNKILLAERNKLFNLPWKLLGRYQDDINRNQRLTDDRNKQKKVQNSFKLMF